ncbi:MAG TPA: ATP-dependent helicase [Clostridia bacterium]|nr:ATP-dependent helicase [Clostridia bacterium]
MRAKLNGPPGTGKTTFLIEIVKTAIKYNIFDASRIAFLSFSKAAAEEARERVTRVFGKQGNNLFPWFRTIHSACCRLLTVPGKQIFNASWEKKFKEQTAIELSGEVANEDEVFVASTIKTKWDEARSVYSYSILTGTDWKSNYYRLKGNFKIPLDIKDLDSFIKKYESFKNPILVSGTHPRLYDFNDMLLGVREVGLCPPVDLLIVDEAQDLSPLMFQIIEAWSQMAKITIIAGDPYQAIYEFQGAKPALMTGWKYDKEYTLDQSFRCPSQVHSASRQIVARMKSRYANDDFNPRERGGFVKRVFCCPPLDDFGKNSVFYLARANFEVGFIEDELRQEGIPYGYTRGKNKSPVLTDYADAILSIERLRGGERISYLQLDDLLEFIPQKENLRHGEKTRIRQMRPELSDFGRRDPQIHRDNLTQWGWTETGIENLKTGRIYSQINKITDKQQKYITTVIKRHGQEAIGKQPKLSIGTLHSVKGKEADFVVIDSKFCKSVQKGFATNPDAEHRLAYVGDTRAKVGVYIKDEVYRSPGTYYPYPAGKLQDYPSCGTGLDREKAIAEILGIKPGCNREDDWDFDEKDMPF